MSGVLLQMYYAKAVMIVAVTALAWWWIGGYNAPHLVYLPGL